MKNENLTWDSTTGILKKSRFPLLQVSVILLSLLALSSCFSPWTGEGGMATIVIRTGSPNASRVLVDTGGISGPKDPSTEPAFYLMITLQPGNVTAKLIEDPSGDYAGQVNTGTYEKITIRAYENIAPNKLRAEGEIFFPPSTPLVIGTGPNLPLSVFLTSATEVTSWADLEAQINNPKIRDDGTFAAGSDLSRPEIFVLKAGGPWTTGGFIATISRDITIRAEDSITITKQVTNAIFNVVGGGTLTMECAAGGTLTLDGGSTPWNSPLVNVGSGTFNMYSGVTLRNNEDNTSPGLGGAVSCNGNFNMYGGEIHSNKLSGASGGKGCGVYVGASGIFNMSGDSKIWGNSGTANSIHGGGVFVENGSIFSMNGGDIYDNSVSNGNGGGVCVDLGANFTMTSGRIYNNDAAGMGNGKGGGVYVRDTGTTFTMVGGTIGHTGTPLLGNRAISGGGVCVEISASFTMSDAIIINNQADSGGGVYVDISGNATITADSVISLNNATVEGGGVYVGNGIFVITGGTIYGKVPLSADSNTAVTGAALYVSNAGGTASLGGATVTTPPAYDVDTDISY